MTDFVHLHVHSNYSLGWGANTIEQICAAAKEKGFSHLALTDTNGIYGLVWFIQTAHAYGLIPLVGSQLKTKQHQAVVLAQNPSGYQTLCKAIRLIHGNDQIDLCDFFSNNLENSIVLSNDLKFIAKLLAKGVRQNIYVELVPHQNREQAYHFAQANRLPVVASNAAYLLSRQDWQVHRLLRAIFLNTTLERVPTSEVVSPESVLITARQIRDAFPDCDAAIMNTRKIADACTFNLDFRKFIFASFQNSTGDDAFNILKQKVIEGVEWRYGEFTEQIQTRMDYELTMIERKDFAPYFLVVHDIVLKAPRTCGRGSAAASLVSYCLGITHVDPIKYDLFFERFLNEGRKDPPDIDVDFPWDERDEILDYIFTTYHPENVAMIANHNCFKARSAVREIAKVYGMTDSEITTITKKMTGYWQPDNIWQLTQTHPVYKETDFPEPWPEIIQRAEQIRGFPRHLSIHCGGVVIAPDGLDSYCATQPAKKILKSQGIRGDKNIGLPKSITHQQLQVIQWEKDQAEDMGLIKIDILGNRSLAVIRDTISDIRKNYGIEIDFHKFNPLTDRETIKLLAKGDTIGVFYVESPAMRLLQQKTGKGDFEHLVIHSSIIRPAANVYINEYIRRLKGGKYTALHPLLDNLLAETYGIMVYQEDISKTVMALADFNATEADDLRKIISKKHKQKQIAKYCQKFFDGAQKKGLNFETCEKIWQMIQSFSGYSFCKPHSASYALVSFQSAYLRNNFPAEFMAAVISNQGGYYSTFAYLSEAKRMGLKVLLPDINHSQKHYLGKERQIRIGFMQLKNLSDHAICQVLSERKRRGAFKSFSDFFLRTHLDPSDVTIFIKAGCFDDLETAHSRADLLWQMYQLLAETRQTYHSPSLFEIDPLHTPKMRIAPPFDEKTMLKHEIETLGFLVSHHPLELYQENLTKLDYTPAKNLAKFIGKRVRTVGWFVTGKTTATKKEELMEFISFEDTTAIYETVFFPKTYAEFVHLMSDSRPFVLEGKVKEDFGAITLHVQHVRYL